MKKHGLPEEEVATHPSILAADNMKRQKYMTLEDEPCRLEDIQSATGKGRGQLLIALQRMKQPGKTGSSAQLWMCLVMKVKSDAVKNNTALQPGMLGPRIKVNWMWSVGNGNTES